MDQDPEVAELLRHLVRGFCEPGREPELAELEGRVREDALRATIREETEAAIREIVGTYDVRIELERATKP